MYFEEISYNVDKEFELTMGNKFNRLLNRRESKDSVITSCTMDPACFSILLIDVAYLNYTRDIITEEIIT